MKTKITAILFLTGLYAAAQEQVLDPVTITSSLTAKPVSKTGRNIVTIRGDEFAHLPVNSVDELLRYLPGMEVQMRGPMGSQSDLVLRGGTFQQVLVILDGVRLNDPNTGHFSSYIPIAPAEIDRIEILKGASSAIYGSEAVGGVIHIITKTFAARPQTKKTRVQGEVMGGEYDLVNANVGGFYQNNSTAIGGGWLSNNTKGQLQRGTRGFVHANTASLSLNHFFNERWQVAVRSSYDNRRFSAQNFYTTAASDTAREELTTFWNQVRLSYSARKHRITMDGGWKSMKDEFLFNKISIANENKSRIWQSTVTDEWKINPNSILVSGVQVINKEINSNDRGDHNVSQLAAFFVWSQAIKDFTINPALRIDWNERSGTELVPQINLSWKKDKFQLRGSAGKTIRDADFTERYNNYNKALVTSGQRIGNPDLEAERSVSYEAGVDHFTTENLKLSGTFFQRYHKRLIDYTPTPYANMPRKDNLVAGGTYALAKNIAKVTTTGAEFDVQFQKSFAGGNRIYSGIGLVWLESESSDVTPSFYISSHARLLNNFFIEYMYKNLFVGVNGIYKSREAQKAAAINAEVSKDYFVLNLKAGASIWKKKIKGFTQINNLFNVKYSDLLGAQMPGRWLIIGIGFDLGN